MPPGERAFRAAALAVVALAGALRFWALDVGLPHPLARPDEEVVLAQTEAPARGEVLLDWSIYPGAYVDLTWAWGAAGLRAGRLLGCFPPGGYLSVLREHPERLILVDRVLSAAAGTATVALLVAGARAALGPGAALAAGALLASSFLHARDSHAAKPDVLFALGALVSLWAMVPLARGTTLRRAAVAGLAVGLTLSVKYPAVILLVPGYVAAALGSPARGWRRLVPAPAAVVGAVAAAVFLASSPSLLLNPRNREGLALLLSTLVPHGVPGAISPPDHPWWGGFAYHACFSLRYGAGLVPTLLAPVAVVWGAASRRRLLVLTAVFAVAYYAVVGISPVNQARYMTPLLPVLALLEGGLLGRVLARRPLVLLAAVLVLVAEPLASAVAHDRIASRTDTRVLATRWMGEHLPRGAQVEIVGTRLWVYGVPQMPPGIEARHAVPEPGALAAAGIGYVLTHDHPLPFSHVDPEVMEGLADHVRLLKDFNPFVGDGAGAVFEPADAYYIPFHGFGAVERPGPRVRIYALR